MRETVMAKDFHPESTSDRVTQIEADLFSAIINRDEVHCQIQQPIEASTITIAETAHSQIAYPWDPSRSASAAFFNHLDAISPLNALAAAEVEQQASRFFDQLDQLWGQSLDALLTRKFASVPQAILVAIAQQATQLLHQGDDLINQLAQCAQAAMPQWAIEDLQVLARPMAHAMRGENPSSAPLNRDWQTLSSTEQAKLSLTIARYAIAQLSGVAEPQ